MRAPFQMVTGLSVLETEIFHVLNRRHSHGMGRRQVGSTTEVPLGHLVECWPAIVIGRVLLGVDAIYGTGIDASGVFRSDAGFGNDIGHRPPPPIRTYGMPPERKIQAWP